MVPEIMIGSRTPVASKCSSIAKSAALAFSVSKMVSTMMRSTPPSTSAATAAAVSVAHLVERDGAEARVVHVGREGERAVHRAQHAGDEARARRRAAARGVRGLAREARPREVQLVHDALEPVVGLRDRGRVEGVGLEDVRARLEVLGVDRADEIGAGEGQQVVVAAQVARVAVEALAAVLASVSTWRWIIVPIAPSSTRMRCFSAACRAAMRAGRVEIGWSIRVTPGAAIATMDRGPISKAKKPVGSARTGFRAGRFSCTCRAPAS